MCKEFISKVYQNSVHVSFIIIFFHSMRSHIRARWNPCGKAGVAYVISLRSHVNTPFSRSEARPRCIYRRLFHDPLCHVYGKGTDKPVWLSFLRSQEETLAFCAGAGDGNVIKMYFLERDPAPMKNEMPSSPVPLSPIAYVRTRVAHAREARDKCTFLEARWYLCHWNEPDRQVRTFVTRASNTSV